MHKYIVSEYAFGRRRHLKDSMNGTLCGRYSEISGLVWKEPRKALLLVSCKDCRKKLIEKHPEIVS